MKLPGKKRAYGEEQPYIPLGVFKIRLPLLHWRWSYPEMLQAMVAFVTGAAAIAYLQDIFGLPFEMALAIVFVHEVLYLLNNILGDPIIGGWITPALPLVVVFLLQYHGTERIFALISLELILAFLFLVLGATGLAKRLVNLCPRSLRAGILVGSSFAACLGTYGFKALSEGGNGFWANPISFSVGVLLALFFLFSYGFGKQKYASKSRVVRWLSQMGFVPALLFAGILGMIVGEIALPSFDFPGIIFNPLPQWKEIYSSFTIFGLGLPPLRIVVQAIPIAIACYLIAFGDLVSAKAMFKQAEEYRPDEKIDINVNRTHLCCGIRNLIEGLFTPTCTLAGPLWSAMTITLTERYKSGRKNMDSIFDGTCTFNTTKALCHLILPAVFLVRPMLPLAMELTWMIQAFGCFYIGTSMCRTNVERGVAGLTGGAIAVCPNPSIGLLIGIVLCIVMEFLGTSKTDRASQVAAGLTSTAQSNFTDLE